VNVVTAIWNGPGQPKYSEDYVTALKRQVPRLVVLREQDGLYEPGRFRRWFCKLEVFRPENRHLRPCLFIDLDTFVLGSLDPILSLDAEKLWLIKQFYQPHKSESGLFIAPVDGISDTIWKRATETNLEQNFTGDGQFLAGFPHHRITDAVDGILSYKVDKLQDSPKNARIVCFHGVPKPADVDGWAGDYFARLVGAD